MSEPKYSGRHIGGIVDAAAGAVGDLKVQLDNLEANKMDKTDTRILIFNEPLKCFAATQS